MTRTELWAALQGVGTLLAVVVALGIATWEGCRRAQDWRRVQDQRREDAEQRLRDEQRRLYVDLTLRIAEAYEIYLSQGTEEAKTRISACLSALPIAYLQVVRHEFGVFPDARDQDRIQSYGPNRAEKARQEIRALLYNLTGAGTSQDYEPPGSPTANRPKPPLSYP